MRKPLSTDVRQPGDSVEFDRTQVKLVISPTQKRKRHSTVKKKQNVDAIVFDGLNTKQATVCLDGGDEHLLPLEDAFEVAEKLDEGGQGVILLARDRSLNRETVVKTLKKQFVNYPEHLGKFKEEARVTAQLDHPGIIPVHSLNVDAENRPCFTMKYVNGMTLGDYLERIAHAYRKEGIGTFDERFSLTTRLEHFLKICDAVDYAHSRAIVHCDLKPGNIMLGEFHEVYVVDWGVATATGSEPDNLETICGTPGYLDPECLSDPVASVATDVFALGVILYEMVTLQPGYMGESIQDRINNMLAGKQPEIEHCIAGYPIDRDLKAVINRARAPLRSERYTSVAQLANDIRRFLTDEEVSSRPDNWARKTIRFLRRHSQLVTICGLSLIMLSTLIAAFSLHRQNEIIKAAKARELRLAHYQASVSDKAHVLDTHFLHLTHLLGRLGDKVSWAMERPQETPITLYSGPQFDSPTPPTGTVYSAACRKDINLEVPVYNLSPGTAMPDVKADLETLFRMQPEFLDTQMRSSFNYSSGKQPIIRRQIVEKGVPIMWIYVGLENGAFVGFPGKGGYPESFDPRKRPWYPQAPVSEGAQWKAPYFDVNGAGLVLPCTYPIFTVSKQYRGVVALDITLDYMISTLMATDNSGDQKIIEKTVLDERGRILVSTRQKKLAADGAMKQDSIQLFPYPHDAIRAIILDRKEGQVVKVIAGSERLFVFSRISSLGWYYLEQFSYDSVVAPNH